jgi:hypothetical protein
MGCGVIIVRIKRDLTARKDIGCRCTNNDTLIALTSIGPFKHFGTVAKPHGVKIDDLNEFIARMTKELNEQELRKALEQLADQPLSPKSTHSHDSLNSSQTSSPSLHTCRPRLPRPPPPSPCVDGNWGQMNQYTQQQQQPPFFQQKMLRRSSEDASMSTIDEHEIHSEETFKLDEEFVKQKLNALSCSSNKVSDE